ncbi:transposase [Parolsenella catena]|uniref:transposase n=1 Tax=Parolsenella catena TaxID=2003188 RepID=UPI002B4B99E9|nr:transposase [Parolsenella catena]
MARGPRAISNSGYYHVMLRGAGRQLLFENDLDRRTFLRYLTEAIAGTKTSLIAWCLMDNHVHLLLCDSQNSLAGAYAFRLNSICPVLQREIGPCRARFPRQVQEQGHRDERVPLAGRSVYPRQSV